VLNSELSTTPGVRGCSIMCDLRSSSTVVKYLVVAALALVTGCSKSGLESSVSGTVSLDGAAIGPGVLVFVPATGGGNPAKGAIQPNGNYELQTSNTAGLHSGKYKVSVTVLDQPPVAPGERSMVAAKSRIPEKYNVIETSGLEFEVTSGSNTIDIELVSTDSK